MLALPPSSPIKCCLGLLGRLVNVSLDSEAVSHLSETLPSLARRDRAVDSFACLCESSWTRRGVVYVKIDWSQTWSDAEWKAGLPFLSLRWG